MDIMYIYMCVCICIYIKNEYTGCLKTNVTNFFWVFPTPN